MCATTATGRRASSGASAARRRAPRPACDDAAKLRARQFSGSASGTTVSARTTTSSTRSDSARIFGSVAPSTGCAGSADCVMNTNDLM